MYLRIYVFNNNQGGKGHKSEKEKVFRGRKREKCIFSTSWE